MKGVDRCRTHGGRVRLVRMNGRRSIYSQKAKGKFKDLMDRLRDQSPEERADLSDEVDVMRSVAERAVSVFQRACFPEDGDKEVKDGTKLMAIKVVQDALSQVGALVEKAARIASLSEDILNPKQVQHIFDQLTCILRSRLEAEHSAELGEILADIDDIRVMSSEQSVSVTVG